MHTANFSTHSGPTFHVEVIILILYYAGEMGSYFLVEPAYESALEDIRRFHPSSTFHQNIITGPEYNQCGDLMPVSDDVLAKFYYSNLAKWRAANLTVFVTNEADCDGHGTGFLATNLRKLTIGTNFVRDIDNKEKWPTRIESGPGGKSSATWTARMFKDFLLHFNWTTVLMVCDVNRNAAMLVWCTSIQTGLNDELHSNVSMLQVDGFFTTTNYTFVMEEIRRQTRVTIYLVFGGTLRKLMTAAESANMTQGNYVHICSILLRHPVFGNYNWRYGEKEDVEMKEAYKSVLFVESDTVNDYPPYGSDLYFLKERWRNATFERYNVSYTPATVNFHLTAAYAMLLSTAQVVQEFLDTNRSYLLDDGRNIARAFYGRTFTLRTGNFSLDHYGTLAGTNFILQQYYPDDALQMILKIQVKPFDIQEVNSLHWPSDVWPVPNRPKCGFDGQDPACWELGSGGSTKAAAGGAVSVALIVLLTAVSLICLRTQRLDRITWWLISEEGIKQMDRTRSATLHKVLSEWKIT